MQVRDIVQKTTTFFKDKGFPTARLDTELLLASALQWDRVKLYMNFDYPLNERELESCRALVRRRAQGEPVAYILGSKGFYKHSFHVEPGVLIPRPETESIVETAIDWLKTQESQESGFRVVDLGSGSGCIGLSILADVPNARLLAVDISPIAVRVTEENAQQVGVSERAKVRQLSVDELSASIVKEELGGLADVVVSNPPYIAQDDPEVEANVRKYEPAEALFSGEDGLDHIRRWSAVAAMIARTDALIMFEIGASQAADARQIFVDQGRFRNIEVVKDLAGHERFIRCRKSGEN